MVEQRGTSTRERIVRKLRSASDPAASAAKLAEELDVSVRTINNHVGGLVEDGRVQSMQIGNATAYYIPESDRPSHLKPEFYCKRCGRAVDTMYDYAKVEFEKCYQYVPEDPTGDFFIFCRFCFADFIDWVHEGWSLEEYPNIDNWEIPEDQRQEVKDDPEILTEPSSDIKDYI